MCKDKIIANGTEIREEKKKKISSLANNIKKETHHFNFNFRARRVKYPQK